MSQIWVPLHDIPAEGREFSFSDPGLWTEPWKEFGLQYEMIDPLSASLYVSPQKEGYLISGTLTGKVSVPCDRCAEPAVVEVDSQFQEFESTTGTIDEDEGDEAEDEKSDLLRLTGQGWELDAAGLLWEQFQLAVPVKPLCRPDCKGLCPVCGADLNTAPCECEQDQGDPRLAVLRGLKISSS
ncbi:YceD family protein [Oceanidesulfovibrio marinus]|uniref:DUF177 domain-containing protein n=1 Tax=Oceanidesulfovibrio marinus TaxID=370038 RepID=A0A6P1ZDN3_9BACT|nr:DUF177 domain-containing protein [Oceanidesulfovibrio marinus]QJT08609.1 DUF177 domain-containing protein [Oceanidesulfovibrio marinus]TVM32555.1 DUF177 domain-containing protein [Oceanidesulfovibrio marinus]